MSSITHFFINIHRSALPIVWLSSCSLKVAADMSGAAPFICIDSENLSINL